MRYETNPVASLVVAISSVNIWRKTVKYVGKTVFISLYVTSGREEQSGKKIIQ